MSVARLRNYEGPAPSSYTFRVLPAGLDLFRRGDPTVAGRIRGRPCPPRALRHATGTSTKCCSATSRRSSAGFLLTESCMVIHGLPVTTLAKAKNKSAAQIKRNDPASPTSV